MTPVPASLAINVAQGARGQILVRVRHCHLAGFAGMPEMKDCNDLPMHEQMTLCSINKSVCLNKVPIEQHH
jgi:hypothetical protein